ncbi:efflux RND transporter periplasmic adaptor subunit [Congregibacter litoralis]|uniref:RND family efflux transporter, MFP subunit n=1 Tax=Congregibacter litoralis KT71 TaxID=314285 RepID=A4A4H0_9GAMM|nr:efflux RND transporter periplasmic adaptor subunit [Congregibacter litoralis]EAQ99105.1 RND family efflux transporter, MFP subunit [Congregibacter litoralis KT71]
MNATPVALRDHIAGGGAAISRWTLFSALGLVILMVLGCSEPPPPQEGARSRPVKIFKVDRGLGTEVRQFPAVIEAAKQAELSFRVEGRLEALPVREGQVVDASEIVAQLDATDFENALEDRRATFENAERNFRRAGELIGSGSISQLDYDRMERDFRSARAALAQAEAELSYATLRAPFKGRIARRYVDNFEEVRAKQSIVYLQDTELLYVIIALPESVIRSVTTGGEDELSNDPVEETNAARVLATASFDNRPNISYGLEVHEVATRANPDTQTYPVTFKMRQPAEFTVLPGMTAQVEVDFSNVLSSEAVTWVPARAVQADAELSPRVFVLNPESMEVNSVSVETGRMSGDMIEVLSGLSGGEEIVAVGAAYLSEGMRVTRMAGGEQAVPRETADRESAQL